MMTILFENLFSYLAVIQHNKLTFFIIFFFVYFRYTWHARTEACWRRLLPTPSLCLSPPRPPAPPWTTWSPSCTITCLSYCSAITFLYLHYLQWQKKDKHTHYRIEEGVFSRMHRFSINNYKKFKHWIILLRLKIPLFLRLAKEVHDLILF